MAQYYLWLKAIHIIAVIAWMAGMLYLPRLFVYHAGVKPGSEASEMLKVMERRLMRIIINPAMMVVFVVGCALVAIRHPDIWQEGWWHMKLTLLLLMFGVHGMFSRYRKAFARDQNVKSAKFFRIMNEVPTLLMIVIVILAVVKPF